MPAAVTRTCKDGAIAYSCESPPPGRLLQVVEPRRHAERWIASAPFVVLQLRVLRDAAPVFQYGLRDAGYRCLLAAHARGGFQHRVLGRNVPARSGPIAGTSSAPRATRSCDLHSSAPVQVTIPLPSEGPVTGYAARSIDIMNMSFANLGTKPAAPLTFTPPTPGFVLELTAVTTDTMHQIY